MKLEEVLPHLRAGGKVRLEDSRIEYNLEETLACFSRRVLLSDYFKIVKEPYKAEHVVEFDEDSHYSISNTLDDTLFNMFKKKTNTKYKVTIEEITE